MYKNIYDYLAKSLKGTQEGFRVTVNDRSDKEPDMLHLMIHPADRDGETADFLLHADGREEFATTL